MADHRCSLLIVDDERHILNSLYGCLSKEFDVRTAASAEEAMERISEQVPDIILSDKRLPGMSGVELLERVRQQHPKTIRILMTGYAELEDAVEAINRCHVFRYLFKPWRLEDMIRVIRDAAHAFRLERSNQILLEELRRLNLELEQHKQELEKRNEDLQRLNEELEFRVNERTRELEQKTSVLERLALTDDLTGLPNRRAVEQILHSEIRRRARYPSPLTVGLIDADHFKDINSLYHYTGGDQVLICLGKTLNSSVRSVDTVGRVGGEEFLVVAPQTDTEGARNLGERIRSAAEHMTVEHHGQQIRVTVSVGMAVLEADCHLSADQLWHEAAVALSEAKARGRNCCVVRVAEEPVLRSTPAPEPTAAVSLR
ncbi:MAG: diguanylate cyclase [Gemmatales bacterium]|nr:diguanylate cyclase [Gemmatales bacterium]MDW8386340.1 diguanylate cyclase [Gemmatales bacterium]